MFFKKSIYFGLLVIGLISLAACGRAIETDNEPSSIPETTADASVPASQTDTTSVEETESTTSELTNTEAVSDSIPPGSIALFATLSGGAKGQSFKLPGLHVTWDSNHYKFLRYVPEAQLLHEFDWASSKSYAKAYIYGFTSGDWVYTVRCSTDTGRKDITRLDPRTGETTVRFGSITTDSRYRGFTILGDRLIYRTKIGQNLAGRRTGGGHVMAMVIGGGEPEKLLDYDDQNNVGTYYAVGDELITIVISYEGDLKTYDIYSVNSQSMAVEDLLFSYTSKEIVTFYEGETALYWGEKDVTSGDIKVIRFPLAEQPSYYMTISENNPQLWAVDESQGKVLIVHSDESPGSPFYYLADLSTDEITELDVDRAFFSGLAHGNGQFYILE